MNDDFAPCRLVEHEGGTFSLVFDDFDATAATFEVMGQEEGGYGWHGVVEALVRMKAPRIAKKLSYDPEASLFAAVSKDRRALATVAGLIRSAMADPQLLREAIENADPELID
jgi:hypothetical protein